MAALISIACFAVFVDATSILAERSDGSPKREFSSPTPEVSVSILTDASSSYSSLEMAADCWSRDRLCGLDSRLALHHEMAYWLEPAEERRD